MRKLKFYFSIFAKICPLVVLEIICEKIFHLNFSFINIKLEKILIFYEKKTFTSLCLICVMHKVFISTLYMLIKLYTKFPTLSLNE